MVTFFTWMFVCVLVTVGINSWNNLRYLHNELLHCMWSEENLIRIVMWQEMWASKEIMESFWRNDCFNWVCGTDNWQQLVRLSLKKDELSQPCTRRLMSSDARNEILHLKTDAASEAFLPSSSSIFSVIQLTSFLIFHRCRPKQRSIASNIYSHKTCNAIWLEAVCPTPLLAVQMYVPPLCRSIFSIT